MAKRKPPTCSSYVMIHGEPVKVSEMSEDGIVRDACKQAIMQDMGEASKASALNGWTATWKQQLTTRFDSKALKTDHPELYQKYARASDTRVFRYKKEK